MNAIHGTIQDGQVILNTPADLPNGTEVTLQVRRTPQGDQLPDDDDDSPEAIAKRLALIERVQPWMSPEEQAEWDKARAEEKLFQLSQWEKWCKEVGGIFE